MTNRMFSKYTCALFWLLILMTTAVYSAVVERPFRNPPIQYSPVYYDNQFYIYDSSQSLVKVSLSGHEEWRINFKTSIRSFQVKFDKIFVVDHLNQLSCYDADYGYQLWGPYKYNVANLYVKYPVGVYLTEQGNIAAFDFFSGQRIWKNTTYKAKLLYDFSINDQVFFSSDGRLNELNMYTGELASSIKTSLTIESIREGAKSIVLIDTQKHIYYYERAKSLIQKLKHYANFNLMDQHQLYFLFQDTDERQGIVKNIESNETVFSIPIEDAIDFQFVGPFSDYIVVQKKDHVDFFEVIQKKEGSSKEDNPNDSQGITTIYGVSGKLIKSFFIDDKVFLFYPKKLLIWQVD